MSREPRIRDLRMILACWATLTILVFFVSGCNTLASLGLPVGASSNKLLDSAKQISERPGRSLALPKELSKQPLAMYIVEIGDSILIEPVRFDASIRLPGDQVVKPDGRISLGEFGRYLAVGKSMEQIELEVQSIINNHIREDFRAAYAKERRSRDPSDAAEDPNLKNLNDEIGNDVPFETEDDRQELVALERRIDESLEQNEISTRLVNWDSKRLYVLGEVNSPGSFEYTGNQTVLDALIDAGGMTTKADRHQIIVSRPTPCSSGRIVMKICYDHVVQLGDASTNYQLLPGDRVFVPALTFCDDLKNSLGLQKHDRCPRCASCPRPCDLPIGCE